MILAFYLIGALFCLAATCYVYRDDLVHLIGAADAEQKAEARANEQMHSRLIKR